MSPLPKFLNTWIRPCPAVAVLAAFWLLPPTVGAQESGEATDDEAAIMVRVLCRQPVPGFTDLKMLQGERVLRDLEITDSLITEPMEVTRGELLLVRGNAGEEDRVPVLKVTIPGQGKRFVLALFASLDPTRRKPYQHRLIRTDNKRFNTSDIYLFNLTKIPIGGTLGKERFILAPNQSAIATPKPDRPGGRMYQSRFYVRHDGRARIFNDTRWPLSRSARVYLFFIPDAERNSVGYQSFREYVPFP